jgi:hypothetical protein
VSEWSIAEKGEEKRHQLLEKVVMNEERLAEVIVFY